MSLKIIEQCQKACISKKIDNKKMRRALEKENISLINQIINDYNSKNIPKDRKNERFKIRDRLAKKYLERKTNQKIKTELDFTPLYSEDPAKKFSVRILR